MSVDSVGLLANQPVSSRPHLVFSSALEGVGEVVVEEMVVEVVGRLCVAGPAVLQGGPGPEHFHTEGVHIEEARAAGPHDQGGPGCWGQLSNRWPGRLTWGLEEPWPSRAPPGRSRPPCTPQAGKVLPSQQWPILNTK